MKRVISALSLLTVLPSIVLSQEHHPRMLDKVDLSQVRQSVPGVVPANTMKYDPLVAEIIHQVNLDSLVGSVRILSGEDSVTVGTQRVLIRSRGGQDGGDLAAQYLKQRLTSYNLQVFDQTYSTSGRNIYAKQIGYLYPEKEYLICAHYDAVAEYCADDNASSTAGVLEVARILSKYDPKYTVVYAFWDEEEQGLVGSEYYASQASSNQEQIQGVLDMDMIAWDGNSDYLADIHTQNTGNSNDLASLLVIVNYLYDLPVKPVIYNPGTWQSDHSSFWNHGWGAVLMIEAYYGGDLNPYYHGADDRIDKFNLPFFRGMSQLSLAALSTLLGVTKGPVIASVDPDTGYQSYSLEMVIKGVNTHFVGATGTTMIWLSRGSEVFSPYMVHIDDNTTIHAYYDFPLTMALGSWDVKVETTLDSVLTSYGGFTLLPPPPIITVFPESLSATLTHGETQECFLTVSNSGLGNLCFAVSGAGRNSALQFDGVNSSVNCGHNPSLCPADSITEEAWIFLSADHLSLDATMIRKDGNWLLELGDAGTNRLAFVLWFHNSGWVRLDGPEIEKNVWHHVGATYDGNTMKLYVDGKMESSLQISGQIYSGYGADLFFGNSVGEWFKGRLDEVRVWNVARTQQEIQQNMNRQLTGSEPGMIGYWQFNEGGGGTAYDLSPFGNHGSITGGVSWVASSAPIMPPWISVTPDSGVCLPQSSMEMRVSFDATQLDTGKYDASFKLRTNDPFHRTIEIPVHLEVLAGVGVPRDAGAPLVFSLGQNYPNPFNPTTGIRFQVPGISNVRLLVYDILGREVAVLVNEKKTPGKYEVEFDASGLSSGIYFYRLTAGQYVGCRKMVLMK